MNAPDPPSAVEWLRAHLDRRERTAALRAKLAEARAAGRQARHAAQLRRARDTDHSTREDTR